MANLIESSDKMGWGHLLCLPISICINSVKLSATGLVVFFAILSAWLLWRFCSTKFGRRISPNGDLAVLITGATSGFGLALAKLFYKLGFTIVATFFNDQEPGYKELEELGSQHIESNGKSNFRRPYLFLVHMDVRSPESIVASGKRIESLLDEHNIKLYSLINNAGVSQVSPFEWCHRDFIANIVNTNLMGTMLVTRQFILRIIQNRGRVINVSSGTFVYPGSVNNIYGSTKAAIVHFSLALHDGIQRYGASSHCVIPGNFLTVSNIVYPGLRAMQKSCSSLTQEEQDCYSYTINQFKRTMIGLLKSKLKNSGDDLEKMAKVYNFEAPDLDTSTTSNKPKRSRGFLTKQFENFLGMLSGQGSTLEGSGSLEAYEQAVCLEKPPLRLYPGNFLYTYFSGPSMEFTPSIINEWLGKYVIAAVSSS